MGLFNFKPKAERLSVKAGRNSAFWEKVKTVYVNVYQAKNKDYLMKLGNAKLIPMDLNTGRISLDINDEQQFQCFNIYELEFERFCSFVFEKWFLKTFPDLSEEERGIVKRISDSLLETISIVGDNDEYMDEVLANSCNRRNDYMKINIDEYCYGYFDGKGKQIKLNLSVSENSRKLSAEFNAAAWMLVDIIYATSKLSKSLCYDEVLQFVQSNTLSGGSKEEILESMHLTTLYGGLSDTYLEIATTINWMATKEFYK